MNEITVSELIDELKQLGLAVHIELATQRIINRRLIARLDNEGKDTADASPVAES